MRDRQPRISLTLHPGYERDCTTSEDAMPFVHSIESARAERIGAEGVAAAAFPSAVIPGRAAPM